MFHCCCLGKYVKNLPHKFLTYLCRLNHFVILDFKNTLSRAEPILRDNKKIGVDPSKLSLQLVEYETAHIGTQRGCHFVLSLIFGTYQAS
jgi:hypothetical protein